MRLKIIFILCLFLCSCAGIKNKIKLNDYRRSDVTTNFYCNDTTKKLLAVEDYIKNNFLNTIKKQVKEKNIKLPSASIKLFSDTFSENYKVIYYEKKEKKEKKEYPRMNKDDENYKEAMEHSTAIAINLLKYADIFQHIKTYDANNINQDELTIQPSIEYYNGYSEDKKQNIISKFLINPIRLVIAIGTFAMVSPGTTCEAIKIKFEIKKSNGDIIIVEAVSGSYKGFFSQWIQDDPAYWQEQFNMALGSAYEKLFNNLVTDSVKLK